MKRIFFLIFVLISCDEIPVEPTNPLDPNNPDYVAPQVNILNPSDNVIINTPSITFNWEGNRQEMLYRYAFNADWSEWDDLTSIQIDYIDEGAHTFAVQSKYTTEDTSSVSSISFEVDAVDGPALLFRPRSQTVKIGTKISFSMLAEEVDSLTAASVILKYNPQQLTIDSVKKGSIFEGATNMIFHHNINPLSGEITIMTALLGGQTPFISGTGSLAEIEITAKAFSLSTIEFNGSETFRGPTNNIITIKTAIGGRVIQ